MWICELSEAQRDQGFASNQADAQDQAAALDQANEPNQAAALNPAAVLDQAAALERDCFGSQAWSRQALVDAARGKNALYLALMENGLKAGASPDGVLVGYCGVWLSFEEGEIMNVAVRKDFRRKGYAGKLLKELLARASQRGVSRFILEVREGNLPARRLYESLGFQEAGIRKNFYSDPKENAIILVKEI